MIKDLTELMENADYALLGPFIERLEELVRDGSVFRARMQSGITYEIMERFYCFVDKYRILSKDIKQHLKDQ